jgi:hypothetical protein
MLELAVRFPLVSIVLPEPARTAEQSGLSDRRESLSLRVNDPLPGTSNYSLTNLGPIDLDAQQNIYSILESNETSSRDPADEPQASSSDHNNIARPTLNSALPNTFQNPSDARASIATFRTAQSHRSSVNTFRTARSSVTSVVDTYVKEGYVDSGGSVFPPGRAL